MNNVQTDQIAIYQTPEGSIRINVLFQDENLWLSQRLMAELFETTPQNITMHLKSIYQEREIDEHATCKEFLQVQKEGTRNIERKTKVYSLEAIIAVGYRVNSTRGTQFRTRATDKLKNYILKGFAVDKVRFIHGTKFDTRYFEELMEDIREIRASERMVYQKITDIYATSVDYAIDTVETEKFFAKVQNKLHFAITGQTAGEIIFTRANHKKEHMGLTTRKRAPNGKIMKSDVVIAKNYLNKDEIKKLNHIVDMYLDFAELQASKGRPMFMKDRAIKLDVFLQASDEDILQDSGKVSRAVAMALAEKEYEQFRIIQDRHYLNDFDRLMQEATM